MYDTTIISNMENGLMVFMLFNNILKKSAKFLPPLSRIYSRIIYFIHIQLYTITHPYSIKLLLKILYFNQLILTICEL